MRITRFLLSTALLAFIPGVLMQTAMAQLSRKASNAEPKFEVGGGIGESFYQSKSLKSYIFEMQKDNLELQKEQNSKSNVPAEVIAKYQEKIDNYTKKLEQYEAEKKEITMQAKKFEAERDMCKLHGSAFGIAVIFLQISILLSSISALAKKKYVWYLSLAVGVVGILYFADGFFLFLN